MPQALARVAELQDAIKRIDIALEEARLVWLRSTPTEFIDAVYTRGRERLEAMKVALQGEIAVVRMGALL